jgi:hypothetical protein
VRKRRVPNIFPEGDEVKDYSEKASKAATREAMTLPEKGCSIPTLKYRGTVERGASARR